MGTLSLKADYALYKESVENPLPKFKFNAELIKAFKEELMPEVIEFIN